MSLQPASKNFKIWKGSTFHYQFVWLSAGRGSDPKDVTGVTGTLTAIDAAGNPLLTLTDGNGGLAFGGLTGSVEIIIDSATTSALTWQNARYQLLINDTNGEVVPLLRGTFTVVGL